MSETINKEHRPIAVIAAEIRREWGAKMSPHAKPYVLAMLELDTVDDKYGMDSADSILRYFLSNATGWRGETARKIKAEIKGLLK